MSRLPPNQRGSSKLTAVDLFCGAGGLTQGLVDAGFTVLAAIDNSELAGDAYEANHPTTRLIRRDIRRVCPEGFLDEMGLAAGELGLLAGCPPCQGFSTMRTRRKATSVDDKRNGLVAQFARFAEILRPRTVMLENVPALANDRRMTLLRTRLERLGYQLTTGVLDAADYGVPQRRRRFIMLGSLRALVDFAPADERHFTVRDAIGQMPSPGESGDILHDHGERRSEVVRRRIAAVPADGGGRTDLPEDHQLECHRREKPGWYDVYGRMAWDQTAPTITGGCINPSKGRFLHPVEDRAITLREAALLQGFPDNYGFPLHRGKYKAAELIGNALPPSFVSRHAKVLRDQLLVVLGGDVGDSSLRG